MREDKACIAAAINVFQDIKNDFAYIGQHMLDNGVDYRYVRRLQNIDIKLEQLVDLMKGELE